MDLNFYNDNDLYCSDWLWNLIVRRRLPLGDVDTRSISDLRPADVAGYVQAHFFAGIGGWPLALKLAGWPADRPVWTGSCPCQPFSAAGKRKGVRDSRDLWPAFRALIAECRPPTVFGEQVASADGRLWFARVRTDLEALGYAVGAADLCAAGVGAPHIRQRLYWVGQSNSDGWKSRQQGCSALGQRDSAEPTSSDGGLGDTDNASGARQRRDSGQMVSRDEKSNGHPDSTSWSATQLIQCLDGKARRVEPRIQPLAHGVSARVGKLRAYGNAIVPQVAAEFIKAFLEI